MATHARVTDQVEQLRQIILRVGRIRSLRDPLGTLAEDLADLSPPQIHTLMWLGNEGELPMGVLAQRIGATLPACTRIVDRLKSAGYLLRERDAHDRRVVRVRLSAKGTRLHERFETDFREQLGFVLGALSDDDRISLLAILERLAATLTAWAEAREDHERST